MRHHRILLISLLIILVGIQFCFAEYWSLIPVKGTHVNARMNFTSVYDTTNHFMYIFGGREYTGSIYTSSKEVYLGYQTSTEYLFNLFPTFGDPIPEREGHSAVIYTNPTTGNLNMIVYGGRDQDSNKIFGDVFHLDLVAHQWTQITTFSGPKPVQRYGHSAVWSPILNSMIVFGGYDTTGAVTYDVYAYNPTLSTWTTIYTVNPPPARAEHSAVMVGNQMYIFGGTDSNLFRGDYWKLDLSSYPYTWTQFTPSGNPPQSRANHTMVYDSDLNRILVFGGRSGSVSSPTYLNNVYGFGTSGAFWSQISTRTPNPPIIREGQTAIYDPGYRRMLIFSGGQNFPTFEDMWELFLAIAPVNANIGSGGGMLLAGPAGRYQPQLIIPAGSLTGLVNFSLSEADDNHNIPTTLTLEPSGTTFDPNYPPFLKMQFALKDVPMDGSTPATMRIFVWDTTSGTWIKIPYRQTVDTVLNIVTVPIYHLSDYGIVGSGHAIPTVEATSTMITSFGGVAQAGPGGTYTGHACACGAGAFPSATAVGTSYPADDHGWSSSYSGSSAVVEFSPDTSLGISFSSVTVQYLDSDIPAGRSESQMNLYYWNSTLSAWQAVTGTQDTTKNIISAPITSLGIYGVGIPIGTEVDAKRWELYQ